MPDGRAVGVSLITVGMDFLLSNQHTHMRSRKHTCRATSCHSAPPARHLVIKGSPSGALHFSTARNESERRRERSGRALMPYALTSARRGNSSLPSSARSSSAYPLSRLCRVASLSAAARLVLGRCEGGQTVCHALPITASAACRTFRRIERDTDGAERPPPLIQAAQQKDGS